MCPGRALLPGSNMPRPVKLPSWRGERRKTSIFVYLTSSLSSLSTNWISITDNRCSTNSQSQDWSLARDIFSRSFQFSRLIVSGPDSRSWLIRVSIETKHQPGLVRQECVSTLIIYVRARTVSSGGKRTIFLRVSLLGNVNTNIFKICCTTYSHYFSPP